MVADPLLRFSVVASVLITTVRTVGYQLGKMYRKLGLRSRRRLEIEPS